MKKFLKILLISIFSITVIFMMVVFGFRFWLKNNLPQYIKEKTPYNITYNDLKIRFLQGDIIANKVNISNKNLDNQEVIGLDGSIDEIYISNMGIYDALVNQSLNSNQIKLRKPNLKITLAKPTDKKNLKKKASIVFENVEINDGNFEIEKHDRSPFFKIKKLSLSIESLNLAEHDAVRKLPFTFDNYTIKGSDIECFPNEIYKITAKSIDTKSRQISVKDFALLPLISEQDFRIKYPHQNLFFFNAVEMIFKDIVLKNNKITIDNVFFSQPKITMHAHQLKKKEKKNLSTYELDLKNINLNNAQFNLLDSKGKEKLLVKNINASIKEFFMNEESAKNKIPFTYKNYKIRTDAVVFNANEYYRFTLNRWKADENSWDLENFSMIPLLSRQEFSKRIPAERDWYDIKIAKTKISGIDFKFSNNQPNVKITNVNTQGLKAIIYRSKFPKDDLSRKKMYSELLRSIKFPLLVQNLKVTEAYLQYEEDNTNDNPAGKLIFSNLNLNAHNINSNKGHQNTMVPIAINCQLMKTSPMKVNWSFDTARNDDFFKISGIVTNLPASQVNWFVRPYLNISIEGEVNHLNFDFNGNNAQISGKMNMKHQNLKVNIMDKSTKEKKKLLSAIVNLVVKTNSNKFPESVEVNVKRDHTKSFFNLFWRGIEDGLKKTLIPKDILEKEDKIKKSVEKVKEIKKETKILKYEIKETF